jgi:hypothetical protein
MTKREIGCRAQLARLCALLLSDRSLPSKPSALLAALQLPDAPREIVFQTERKANFQSLESILIFEFFSYRAVIKPIKVLLRGFRTGTIQKVKSTSKPNVK